MSRTGFTQRKQNAAEFELEPTGPSPLYFGPMSELVITQKMAPDDPEVIILTLVGNLDTVTSESFAKRIREIIASGWVKIIVDLENVEFVSSSGWGSLIGSLRRTHEAGGDMVLANMKGQVQRVFKMMGFRAVLRAFASVDEAQRHFAAR